MRRTYEQTEFTVKKMDEHLQKKQKQKPQPNICEPIFVPSIVTKSWYVTRNWAEKQKIFTVDVYTNYSMINMAFAIEVSGKMNSDGKEHILVPGLMSDMSIKGPVFWMRAGWWTETPVQKLWGFPVWLNSVSVTGIVALSSPTTSKTNLVHQTYKVPSNCY